MEATEAELAFLQSMSNTPANNGGAQQTEATDEYDPTAVIVEAGQEGSRGTSSSGSMPQSPSTPVNDGNAAALSAPVDEPVKAQQAPRTVGGFVVDDDDDEEEEDELNIIVEKKADEPVEDGNIAQVSADAAQRSISQTPINGVDVPVPKAQDQDLNGALTNGAAESVSLSSVPANADAPPPSTSTPVQPVTEAPLKPQPAQATATANKARLPQDVVGRLEDRIAEDPRGDLDAWLTLIAEYRRRNKLDDARAVYDRFFKVFPSAVEQWLAYANMELQEEELQRLEQIFGASLANTLCVQLWTMYLDYVRRRNNLVNDADGKARATVLQTFQFVLDKIGIDKDSGGIWEDYLEFLRSGPGRPEGTTWQDGQKRDEMRAAFQRAIAVPTKAVSSLWKQYDNFELGINKVTGRKFLQEKMSTYVTARSAHTHLANITETLNRYATPRLAPLKGFDGDEDFTRQVEIWGHWIQWEKDDPLVLKLDDAKAYRDRVLYVYKQATMPLRFVPEIWFEAANWCYENGLETEGNDFLTQGMTANPESCLLAFKRGERHELTANTDDTDAGKTKKGALVREPYDKVLEALYALLKKTKARQAQLIANVQERLQQEPLELPDQDDDDDDIDEETLREKAEKAREAMINSQLEFISRGGEVQMKSLKRTITHVWINLMRAMRRVQGKGTGKTDDASGKPGGFRAIFQEGRKRGNTTCEFWLAIAGLEHHYREPVAGKLFDRATKLYPDDPLFQLEYIKFLIDVNDVTNARAVFATAVGKMTATPEKLASSKPLFAFFHEYESHFGELSQIVELEKRMAELFPEDPLLANFSRRYQDFDFDATSVKHIISQTAQARPKALVPPPAVAVTAPEAAPPSVQDSPRPSISQSVLQVTNSPKRPLPLDESDLERPSKIARGGSPLKGAAGRRMAGTSRVQDNTAPTSNLATSHPLPLPPAPLAQEITYMLSIIPPAYTYNVVKFDPPKLMGLLDSIDLTKSPQWRPPMPPVPPQVAHLGGTPQMGYPQMFPPPPGPPYGYPR